LDGSESLLQIKEINKKLTKHVDILKTKPIVLEYSSLKTNLTKENVELFLLG